MTSVAAAPHHVAPKVPRALKFAIGAGAGVCLALVKLLEVNFYIGQPRAAIEGGLLAAAAFLVVGAVFTAFGTEEHDTGKLFMQGLLAPSLIIAIAHRGADVPAAADPHASIPTLGAVPTWLVPTLFAEEQQPSATAVKTITRAQVEPSVSDGALMLLGRSAQPQSFLYVVGKTSDKAQAEKTRAALQAAVGTRDKVNVVKAENGNDLYVVVGTLQSAADAAATKQRVIGALANGTRVDQQALKLLSNGPVVDARALVSSAKF